MSRAAAIHVLDIYLFIKKYRLWEGRPKLKTPLPLIFDPNWRMRLQMETLLTCLPKTHTARPWVLMDYCRLLMVAATGGKMRVLVEEKTGLGVGRVNIHAQG